MIPALIGLLVFLTILFLGGTVLYLRREKQSPVQERLQKGAGLGSVSLNQAPKESISAKLAMKLGKAVSVKGTSSQLQTKMTKAGYTNPSAMPIFLGIKFFLLIMALMVTGTYVSIAELAPSMKMLIVMGGIGAGFFLPNMYLSMKSDRRTAEIRRYVPAMVDLLEVCVTGGMGLDMAWNAVSGEIGSVSPLLAEEMRLTNLEMHLGEERGNAMRNMAERTGVEEISQMVAVLVQSERFGTSIADALLVFSASMRELRSQRAEEMAEQMSVKLLFPMIVFIFPVELIVAVGPAIIVLIDLLG